MQLIEFRKEPDATIETRLSGANPGNVPTIYMYVIRTMYLVRNLPHLPLVSSNSRGLTKTLLTNEVLNYLRCYLTLGRCLYQHVSRWLQTKEREKG